MINILIIDKPEVNTISIAKAFALFFIPYLIGFISASFTLLRKAIPTPSDETSGNALKRWLIIVPVGFLLVPWILICAAFVKSIMSMDHPQQKFGVAILYSVLYNGLYFITSKFVYQICGVNKMAVHRTPNGGYLKCLHDYRTDWGYFIARLLIVVSSFLVVLGLLMTSDLISIGSVSIATMALVHLVSGSSFLKSSLPKMIKRYILILVTIAAFIFLEWLICQRRDNECVLQTFARVWYRVLFVPVTLCSAFSGSLIARMLRFDCQRHLDKSNGGEEIDLVTVPAPTFSTICYNKEDLVEGILIPQWASRAFPKPYFAVSLVVWSIAQITTFSLYFGVGFPAVSNPYAVYALALLFEFPIIVAVLLFFAAVRKEAKALWNYREGWRLSPAEGAISLPSDNITT